MSEKEAGAKLMLKTKEADREVILVSSQKAAFIPNAAFFIGLSDLTVFAAVASPHESSVDSDSL